MRDLSNNNLGTSSRRDFVKGSLGLAVISSAAFATSGAEAAPQTPTVRTAAGEGPVITRFIPKTEEATPAIGLGTFMTFDVEPGGKRDHLLEVTRRFWEAGGRVIDTSPLYGMAEVNVGHFASKLGITDQMFVSNKVWDSYDFPLRGFGTYSLASWSPASPHNRDQRQRCIQPSRQVRHISFFQGEVR